MPIYEYECDVCRHRFEKRQRFFDEAVAECPKCQSKSQRVFCPAPVIFKGSGFYITDYRKEKDSETTVKPKEESVSKPKVESAAK
jgi:putative FmdB family regulatory protein